MSFILQLWQLLLAILSGWIHHRQQKMIEFQNDQIESRSIWVGPARWRAIPAPAEAGQQQKR